MFLGRDSELRSLQTKYKQKNSQLVVVYGRRRIGKSELLKHFCKEKSHLFFEGLESELTKVQIEIFLNEFGKQTQNPFVGKLKLKNWTEVFDYLTEYLRKKPGKTILVFDEFQWISCQQSHLIHLLKLYWDNHWKSMNLMIILCGSVAHFMVKKVIKSKALYGRINLEIGLTGLNPKDARKMIPRRGQLEVLKYLLLFGTVPKYLEEIEQDKSFDENINRLCFSKNGYFVNEIDKVFFSQFREAQTYRKIVEALSQRNMGLEELSHKLKMKSGGGLKSYLSNLQNAGFIRSYASIHQKSQRNQKFKLFDEYLLFYFKFIAPRSRQIAENTRQQLFKSQIVPKWQPWLGIAFEVFCLKNAMSLAEAAGFAEEVISFAPLFQIHDSSFQIDLIFNRIGSIRTVCEIKFHENPITTKIIPDIERKLKLLPSKNGETIEKMLIAPMGADQSLLQAEYFHHIIDLKDIF